MVKTSQGSFKSGGRNLIGEIVNRLLTAKDPRIPTNTKRDFGGLDYSCHAAQMHFPMDCPKKQVYFEGKTPSSATSASKRFHTPRG